MTLNSYLQLAFYMVVVIGLAKPLGAYMARVYEGKPFGLDRVLGPVERLIYRLSGVRSDEEMNWKTYALAMLVFNAALIKPAILMLFILTIITGVVYPFLVTGIAQLIFPAQANGSLIHNGDKAVGSAWIGQQFDDPKHFWCRPSATGPFP
jgi:K+-transporting ATPase A subunit